MMTPPRTPTPSFAPRTRIEIKVLANKANLMSLKHDAFEHNSRIKQQQVLDATAVEPLSHCGHCPLPVYHATWRFMPCAAPRQEGHGGN